MSNRYGWATVKNLVGIFVGYWKLINNLKLIPAVCGRKKNFIHSNKIFLSFCYERSLFIPAKRNEIRTRDSTNNDLSKEDYR